MDPELLAEGKTKEELALLGYQDPVFFCRYFLKNYFPKPMPWVHRGILAIMTRRTDFLWRYGEIDKIIRHFTWKTDWKDPNSPEHPIFTIEGDRIKMTLGKYTLLMLPRGFSKTTLAGIAVNIWNICYNEIKFGAYVSEASTHANMQISNIAAELEADDKGNAANIRLYAVFGRLAPMRTEPQVWKEGFIETVGGTALVARGRGAQIRGLLHKASRPQRITVDDVEDEESVKTEEQRLKTRNWAYGSLMPALPELDPNASITALGTLLHPDSLLAIWALDPVWTVIKFGPIDKDGEALWPENLSKEKLEAKRRSAILAGTLSTFYLEYYGEIVAPERMKFKQEWFLYEKAPPLDELQTAIYCDPAISEKRRADRTAIYVVGITKKGKIYVLDYWTARGASPRQTVDMYFLLAQRWKCRRHGCESIAYQAALVHLLREEMFRKHYYFEIEPVPNKARKEERILGILQPRFAAGYILFTKRFIELEQELLEYGMPGVHDDQPDCLAGAIAMLDPYAAQAAGDKDPGDDSMQPLEDDLEGHDYEPEYIGSGG